MMIADGVDVLPIPRNSQGATGFLNLTLILDEQNGNTLACRVRPRRSGLP